MVDKKEGPDVPDMTAVSETGDPHHLNSEAQDTIGRKLRQVYAHLLSEPLPDRVRDLLDKLTAGDPPTQGGKQGSEDN